MSAIGFAFVAFVVIVLAVNAFKTPGDFLDLLVVGLTVGMVYALIALGYSLVYGILELINFAHGDVFMLGAMFTTTLVGAFGLSASNHGQVLLLMVPLLLLAAAGCALLNTTIEFVATEGVLLIDDTHRDVVLNTMKGGMVLPLSTMPGEQVGHVYQGPMEAETIHFIEAVALDRPVLVTPEQARQVMEVTLAADLSAERHQPVSLPLQS